MSLYHLVPKSVWDACKASSSSYFPSTYQHDGFIHLTQDPKLLLPVANHFYTEVEGVMCSRRPLPHALINLNGTPGRLSLLFAGVFIVLQLDAQKLTAEVKFEPAAPVGEQATSNFGKAASEAPLFPHLYGTIDFPAVQQELEVTRSSDGVFTGIAGLAN